MKTEKIKRENGGRYFSVEENFQVFAHVGFADSNASYGSARILRPVYREVMAHAGDQIHILPGGDFLVTEDCLVYSIKFEKPEFAPFEHRHVDLSCVSVPAWALQEIARGRRFSANYVSKF